MFGLAWRNGRLHVYVLVDYHQSMGEREPGDGSEHRAPSIQFGDPLPRSGRRRGQQGEMFSEGDDLPLFSGTPQEVIEHRFEPEDHTWKQAMLPDMPDIDYEHVLELDKQRRRGRKGATGSPITTGGTLWRPGDPTEGTVSPTSDKESARQLREALAAYHLDMKKLRQLAAMGTELTEALKVGNAPPEAAYLLSLISSLFRPTARERIKSPGDAAVLLMLEMSHLDQEQMRVVCLNTQNQLQKIHTVYQGSLNAASIRIGEIFKEPLRINSAAIILAHNHPSGEPMPSPEDVLVTREIVSAGNLLDCEVLDHLVIGQGKDEFLGSMTGESFDFDAAKRP
jgi:DNA repair protein RadC